MAFKPDTFLMFLARLWWGLVYCHSWRIWEASHVHSIARSATTYLDRIAIWDLTHKKKIAHSISMTFGIRGESLCLCFEYYSPVLSLASLELLSLKTTLLSWHLWHWDLRGFVKKFPRFWKNARLLLLCHLAFWQSLFCLWNYSPVQAFVALGLERFCEKVSAILKKRALSLTLTHGLGHLNIAHLT